MFLLLILNQLKASKKGTVLKRFEPIFLSKIDKDEKWFHFPENALHGLEQPVTAGLQQHQ